MSDNEEEKPELKPFEADRAKRVAKCKKCKSDIAKGQLRIAKVSPHNPFSSGPLKLWYHFDCLFDLKTKKGTVVLESIDMVEGYQKLSEEDKDLILEKVNQINPDKPKESTVKTETSSNSVKRPKSEHFKEDSKDNSFREFRKIVCEITDESSYLKKTAILNKFLIKGSNGTQFEGDLHLWIKLLLPGVVKRIYNLQSKQIIKLFSRIFGADHQDMLTDLQNGDVAETVGKFFEKSRKVKPSSKSKLTMQEVDRFLEKLSTLTQEDPQTSHFEKFCEKCSRNDLVVVIRLIKHDLRINAGARHILEALNPEAHDVFQTSKDLDIVISKFGGKISPVGTTKKLKEKAGLQLLVPVSPMLAEACKDLDKVVDKAPNGFYSEIKYDGERLQIHKKGREFKFYSRNLKPVQEHKISRLHEFLPKAFPNANDLILDSEILVVNTDTGDLLPFGSLGIHKKTQFKSAEICLFIFDCIYYNGEDLTKRPIKERKKLLEENIKPIKNHVQMSEYKLLTHKNELINMIQEVLTKGLEGLVLKDVNSIYEPGKRHWLKIKKDYLCDGQMADTADLVVLGAWFGTGKKGGMLSIFLMGCLDLRTKVWKTVTKVHGGLDDATLEKMQEKLKPKMQKCDPDNLPKWIKCNRSMIPDYISKQNPETCMPVWEITGAEFSKAEIHTADGISIRFPRITKIRDDKKPSDATNLDELKHLFEESKKCLNLNMLDKMKETNEKSEKKLVKSSDKNKIVDSSKSLKRFLIDKKKDDESDGSNSSAKKKMKLDSGDEKPASNYFSGIILFLHPTLKEKLKDDVKKFCKMGGIVIENSMKCNYALHPERLIDGNVDEMKNRYNINCRHVYYTWLTDSVKEGEKGGKSVFDYFVVLKPK